MMSRGFVGRIVSIRVLTAAVLSALTFYFTCILFTYRLPGPRFLLAVALGLALSAVSVLVVVGRVFTATLPSFVRPLAGHAENFIFLLVVNLIIVSLLAPIFRMIALTPMRNPVVQRVFGVAGELSGHVLLALFAAGVAVLAWVLVLRVGDRVFRWGPARGLARALDRVAVTMLVLYCVAVGALAANSVLDTSPAVEHRSEIVAVSGVTGPFGLGQISWADVRSWTEPGQVERVLLIAQRDQPRRERALPGLPVRVEVRAGFLGFPWVVTVARDQARQTEQVLEAVPTAAGLRKWLISTLAEQQRWKELRVHAEAHLRAYPSDREWVLLIAKGLRQHGQPNEAAALEQAVQP
ncbi:MAG TPA: hypothetical protein VGV13_11935 [Methylomirabilota bacterium]|jgi:hypothetical protein|nr:hypothetical protein [Methylomirabilota bacterium]